GKWRRYFSILNFVDTFKLGLGTIQALIKIFRIYPDVIFSKGGYASMPTLIAARVLGIPTIIHESDSHPGRASLWASKFAQRIAISYSEVAEYFPPEKTAITGNPLRRDILNPVPEGAKKYLKLQEDLPVILIIGGSLGAQKINNTILDSLDNLLNRYQIIHQTGANNFDEIKNRSQIILQNHPHKNNYQIFPYLNDLAMRMSAGVADVVISRAGSAIFEIAHWGIPAIIIPIPETISHDQTNNAFTYARSGAAIVIEEANLSDSVLISELDRILLNPELKTSMKNKAKDFSRPDAGEIIAQEIIDIATSHEK
ncbi:MAG: UDP-N-acetylglucosamine--N-acetylmuramyl-(pentapeptide) pyrophosphoryl-undecaprenol, partial [Patescibacteria group bacterium]|nr:UDP-N-acetylglucosamine--N-acetylmuramyl-(pentapeptide) pyrophosphoryl-undecaprenol [Patescibacteria group bacterium]